MAAPSESAAGGTKRSNTDSTSRDNIALDGRGHLQVSARRATSPLRSYYGPCLYTSGKLTPRGIYNGRSGHYQAYRADVEAKGQWVFDQPFYLRVNPVIHRAGA
jgi:hypothetical protein